MTSQVTQKMGFWSVVSIVLSSQIGSGIFMLPASLASFGAVGAASWLISGGGAILLALVFANLSKSLPQTGGPHVFVGHAFGHKLGFLTAWSYWIISWASTSLVVVAAIGYLDAACGGFSQSMHLILEVLLLLALMGLNLLGVRTSGQAEFFFTILKIVPLILLPLACIPFFQTEHFVPFNLSDMPTAQALNGAVLLTFWGFIGVETATTPAGSVDRPDKTIPRAIVLGTTAVAIIYFISCTSIMGVISPDQLKTSQAPFADVTRVVFGGNWHISIALMATIVCMGSLNAWILTSSQIALGAAQGRLFPQIFGRLNAHGAPTWGIVISSLAIIPLLFLTLKDSMVEQLTTIIDVSVTAFVLIYSLCVLSFIKLCFETQKSWNKKALGIVALIFCLWTLYASPVPMVGLSVAMFISGIPVYHYIFSKRSK